MTTEFPRTGQYVLVDYHDPGNPDDVRTFPAKIISVDALRSTFDCVWIASDRQISHGLPIATINTTGKVHGGDFIGFGSMEDACGRPAEELRIGNGHTAERCSPFSLSLSPPPLPFVPPSPSSNTPQPQFTE